MTTEWIVTLADNGYVLETNDGDFLCVYESDSIPDNMAQELIGELEHEVENGTANKYKVTVTVESYE